MTVGHRVELTNGSVVANPSLVWQTSNPAVATITQGGVLTGVARGEVTVSATTAGVTGRIDMTITSYTGTYHLETVNNNALPVNVANSNCAQPPLTSCVTIRYVTSGALILRLPGTATFNDGQRLDIRVNGNTTSSNSVDQWNGTYTESGGQFTLALESGVRVVTFTGFNIGNDAISLSVPYDSRVYTYRFRKVSDGY